MGCTNDFVHVTLKNRSYLESFLNEFYGFFKDYLYDKNYQIHPTCIFSASPISECYIDINEEPLFKMDESGAQVDLFIKEYVKKYPDVDISMFYTGEELDCDGAIHIKYEYNSQTKKLNIEKRTADCTSIRYCPECDEDFEEAIAYLDEHIEGQTYRCPVCGADIEYDVDFSTEIIKLEDL